MVAKIWRMFEGSSPQLLAVLAGTVNAIADGMQYGWTAPMVPVLQSQDPPIISDDDVVWIESLYMLGGIAGLPLTVYIVDKIGRKNSVLASSFTSLIGWILIGVANRKEYIFVGRFFTGIAADIAFNASPMYIAEIAHQKIRGFLAGIIYLMMLAGIIIIYATGPFIPIYASCSIGALILIFQLVTFPFMPESPYYLLYVNKHEEAKKALEKFRVEKDVEPELTEIAAAVERQKTEKGRPQDLFLIRSNRRAVTIMWFLNAVQHMAGISVILMNLHEILDAAGSIYIQPENAAIIFSCLMLVSASVSTLIVDKCGRKILLLISSVLSGVSLLALSVYFHLKDLDYNLDNISWIPVVSVMVYAVVFKLGLGIIPIVITAELFSARVKGMGMATSDGVYVLASTISIYVYDLLKSYFSIYAPFYFFTFWAFMATFFVIFQIPETKGKTLEEIQMILKKH